MKISTFITILAVVGVVFFLFAQMVAESNEYYEVDINSSDWEGKYNFAGDINESIEPIRSSLETIEDEDAGWFTRIAAGITAIPRAVTLIPSLLFEGFKIAGIMITDFFTVLGVPSFILIVSIILLLIWGIIKLVELFHKQPL